jgi:hypothetical protein
MRYRPGDRVKVAARPHEGHHRTPGYVKGKSGRVERFQGSFTNPETRAYGEDGLPERGLYLVGFAQHDVWPDSRSPPHDRIFVDIFEHWLEQAE